MAPPTKSSVTRPRAWYDLALDDRLFRLATRFGTVNIETAPPEAPRVDTASNPDEIVEEHGRVFARSVFEGGEGLFRAHVPGAEPDRFWDSRGLRVAPTSPGELPNVELAHQTEQLRSSTSTAIRLAFDPSTLELWMTDGQTIYRTDDPLADAPSFVEDDPHDGETATTVGGIALLGDTLYAALGANGIHERDPSTGAWTHYSDLQAVRIWAAQGRLIASDGSALYEVTASGAAPSSTTTLKSGREWVSVADGGAAVLAAADDGYIYAFTSESGSLVLSGQTEFPGEQPTAVAATRGSVAIGTRQGDLGRLWIGTLSDRTFTIVDTQLVRQWDGSDGVDRRPHHITADRTSFYTAVALGSRVDVWRYELRTSGLSRHLEVDVEDCSHGLLVAEQVAFVAICNNGLYREDVDNYVDEGYLIGPLGDFSSASPKSWVGARLDNGDPSSGSIELYYTTSPEALLDPDSALWKRAISRTSGSSTEEVPLTSVTGRWIAGMVKVSTSDQTRSPDFRAFGFRAFASAGEGDVVLTLPVNVSDQIERRGRHRVRVKGLGDKTYLALRAFEGRAVLAELYRPSETVRGLVESVGTPVAVTDVRGSVTHVSQVTIRGRRTSTSTSTIADGAFGTYTYGETPFGGF